MSNNFKTANAHAIVAHLRATGEDPNATTAPIRSTWGCSNPACCPPVLGCMLAVRTKVSNTRLHRIMVTLGL